MAAKQVGSPGNIDRQRPRLALEEAIVEHVERAKFIAQQAFGDPGVRL